jgi:hypothetical protein
MKKEILISGFTFARNTSKLYYPFRASIESILPLVDEFVVALAKGDEDDTTLEQIQAINSDKIKILYTDWDTETYSGGTEYAHQTDLAKEACSGEWLFYLQADEVIHEQDLEKIRNACQKYQTNFEIEGFLFKYFHFFGDYEHYHSNHTWYPREIRIVRNIPEIHSFGDAQSFRRIPDFDGKSYREKEGSHKLKVVLLDAFIYHYGWVRPPRYMQKKSESFMANYQGEAHAKAEFAKRPPEFAYGPLGKISKFKKTHPQVMAEWIAKFDWGHQLNYTKKRQDDEPIQTHEKLKSRVLTFIEKYILGFKNKSLGYKNWKIVKKEKSN